MVSSRLLFIQYQESFASFGGKGLGFLKIKLVRPSANLICLGGTAGRPRSRFGHPTTQSRKLLNKKEHDILGSMSKSYINYMVSIYGRFQGKQALGVLRKLEAKRGFNREA